MAPTISVVIYKVEVVTVVHGAKMSLSHGKADTVCKTLTQGTSGDFDAYVQKPVRIQDRGISGLALPSVWFTSGWPGVNESICLNALRSSRDNLYPRKCNRMYCRAQLR